MQNFHEPSSQLLAWAKYASVVALTSMAKQHQGTRQRLSQCALLTSLFQTTCRPAADCSSCLLWGRYSSARAYRLTILTCVSTCNKPPACRCSCALSVETVLTPVTYAPVCQVANYLRLVLICQVALAWSLVTKKSHRLTTIAPSAVRGGMGV